MNTSTFKGGKLPWLLLLPTLIILVLFLYYPAWQSIILSLYRSNLLLGTRKFIGLGNFKMLFSGPLSPAFYQVFIQTILFGLLVTFSGIAVSLVLASMIQSLPPKKGRIYSILLIWPFALSPAAAGTLFLFMFNPEVGVVNILLETLFHLKPRWLDDPILAFILVTAAAVWKYLGYNIVFYIAALQNVSPETYEAAEIDGAGSIRRFFNVTIPMVSPTTFFLLFTNLTYSFFESFAVIDILTKGGPVGPAPLDQAGISTILIYKIFQDGFGGSSNMGFAAAQSLLLMLFIALITWMQFSGEHSRVHYGEN